MKYSILLGTFAFLLFSGFSFATAGLEQCAIQEEDCMQTCCEQAGGVPETAGEYINCGGSSDTPEAAGAAYNDCVFNYCRTSSLECAAPSSSCASDYRSCFSSCVAGGNSAESCDATCFDDAAACMADYLGNQGTTGGTTGGSSCCGPALILGFALLGAFAAKKK